MSTFLILKFEEFAGSEWVGMIARKLLFTVGAHEGIERSTEIGREKVG